MPCCGKEKKSNPTLLHPFLDRTELGLQAAWITEITPEQKQNVTDLIKAIQALKNPYLVPLEAQLASLADVAGMIGLGCRKCQQAWFQEVVRKIHVRWLLEKGKRREAVWLWVRSEFWGKIWMLRALPVLLRKRHPAEPTMQE